MDDLEKAKIRIKRWIDHNASHQEEYEQLAEQLEAAGETAAGGYLRELVEYQAKGLSALEKALAALEDKQPA